MANPKIINIELDDTPEINSFVAEIASLPIEEQIGHVADFIKSKFKSAIPVNINTVPEEEREKIKKVFDQ